RASHQQEHEQKPHATHTSRVSADRAPWQGARVSPSTLSGDSRSKTVRLCASVFEKVLHVAHQRRRILTNVRHHLKKRIFARRHTSPCCHPMDVPAVATFRVLTTAPQV